MSELSKNKILKKLYDFGDRITPQKWAKAMDILSPEAPPEDAPVIQTTYEEAKDLYKSGGMKTGVYYKFYWKIHLRKDGNNATYECDIQVYIDSDNTLKAKGYNANDDMFIADYTFDTPYITYEDNDSQYDTEEFKYFVKLTKHDILIDLNDIQTILNKFNIKNSIYEDPEDQETIIVIYDAALLYDGESSSYIIFTKDYNLRISDVSVDINNISISKLNVDPGFLSNLTVYRSNGSINHHSHFIEYYTDYGTPHLIYADVQTNLLDFVIFGRLNIGKGSIINTTFNINCDEVYIYNLISSHAHIIIDSHSSTFDYNDDLLLAYTTKELTED